MHQSDVAWLLADAVRDGLLPWEKTTTYVALGGGDTYTAIRLLVSAAVRADLKLPRDVTDELAKWWSVQNAGDSELGEQIALLEAHSAGRNRVWVPPLAQRSYLVAQREYRRTGPARTRRP